MKRNKWPKYGLVLIVVVGVITAFYFLFLRADYQAIFESETGVQLPEGTQTVASCAEWGIDAAVFEIEESAWPSFVAALQAASPTREYARHYSSGLLCDTVLQKIDTVHEAGSVYEVQRHNEGVVWAINNSQHRVVWEVWY